MKYIRTKDGVYEAESTFLNNDGKWIGYNIVGDDMVILREQVIAQADTIEELVDEYIIQDNIKNYRFVFREEEDRMIEYFFTERYTIFGAIWVIDDNGAPTLKPISKTNSKWEFELI